MHSIPMGRVRVDILHDVLRNLHCKAVGYYFEDVVHASTCCWSSLKKEPLEHLMQHHGLSTYLDGISEQQ